jgi:amino acid transporter
MSGRYVVQVASVVLLAVLAILVAATWYTIGTMTEGHVWRHRLYTIVTTIVAIAVVAFFLYIGFGPGRELLR